MNKGKYVDDKFLTVNYQGRKNKDKVRAFLIGLMGYKVIINGPESLIYYTLGGFRYLDCLEVNRLWKIKNIHSFEIDSHLFQRSNFNKPSFVELHEETMSDWVSSSEGSDIVSKKGSMVFLDYTSSYRQYIDNELKILIDFGLLKIETLLILEFNSNPKKYPPNAKGEAEWWEGKGKEIEYIKITNPNYLDILMIAPSLHLNKFLSKKSLMAKELLKIIYKDTTPMMVLIYEIQKDDGHEKKHLRNLIYANEAELTLRELRYVADNIKKDVKVIKKNIGISKYEIEWAKKYNIF